MKIGDQQPIPVITQHDIAASQPESTDPNSGVRTVQEISQQVARAYSELEASGTSFQQAPVSLIDSSTINFAQLGKLEANLDGLAFNVQDALVALHQMTVLLRETERNNWIATANDILAQGHQAAGELRQKAAMTMAAGAVKGASGIASSAVSIGFAASAAKDLNSSSSPDTTADINVGSGTDQAINTANLTATDVPDTVSSTATQSVSTTTDTTQAQNQPNKTVDSMEQTKIQQDLTRAKIEETKVDRVNQQVQTKLQLGQGVSTMVSAAGDMASSAFQAAAANVEAKAEVTRAEKDRRQVEAGAQQDFANELRDSIQSITSTFQSIESARHRAMGAIYNA